MPELAAPVTDFSSETSTEEHPLATHPRCSHVDCRLGSLAKLRGVLVAMVGDLGDVGICRGKLTLLVLVVFAMRICNAVRSLQLCTWWDNLKGCKFWDIAAIEGSGRDGV